MKRFICVVFIAFVICAGVLQAQIPRTLSYQGVLTDAAGKPRPNNSYQFTFRLYEVATGGTALWTEQKTLPVTNGLFATALGDQVAFGAAVKFDRQYWLGIQVGNEPELSPRIPLTSVGYSMSSLRADTARVAMATNADTTWRHDGSNIYRLNGNIGIGRRGSNKKLYVVGGNVQVENLPGQPTALTIGNDSTGSTYLGILTSAYSSGHIELQGVSREGTRWGDIVLNPRGGVVGIGTFDTGGRLDVWGDVHVGTIETGVNNKLVIRGPNSPANQTNVQDLSFEFASAGSAKVRASRGGSWDTYLQFLTNDMNAGGDNPVVRMHIANNGIGIGTTAPSAKLDVAGRTKTCVLEITGGCDLAEPFPTSEAESLPPGAIVVIDENNPGHLKLSREPYDKGVAGIVSGAGGINPGLTLRQEGVMEAGQLVTLTGKVYALATAANGPIKPGDLLTTSKVAGHAMKATDFVRWQGAVIGKAMSGLEQGEGLVLVLVNLQ